MSLLRVKSVLCRKGVALSLEINHYECWEGVGELQDSGSANEDNSAGRLRDRVAKRAHSRLGSSDRLGLE